MTNNDLKKKEHERLTLKKFIEARDQTDVECHIENRNPPEPDILYSSLDGKSVAFELVEVCAPEIARAISHDARNSSCSYTRSEDPSKKKLKDKLSKIYKTEHPIELLLYTNGRVVTPDDLIIANCKPLIEATNIKFRKIWLWGDSVHMLYNEDSSV